MSGRRSISNSFNVITVDDPVSVIAQYAPTDNPSSSQIHDTWQNGDLYMRTKSTEDGATWSLWHKIVGESGGETDYTFGISAYKTTSNASTAPSDISSWSDAPLAVTSSKPYLWAKVQQKSWNASTQSYDVDSTRYIRLTGEDGSSVMAQYAPNNNPSSSQIHDTWQSGDLYMRTKSTTDSNWSSWHKIVGESGDETDYSFNISKSKTSTNSTTAPSDCYYNTWQDAPVAPTSAYPYLWMKVVKKTWNESTQSYDSGTPSYARVTGEKGDDGVSYCFVFTKAAARVDEGNNVTAELAGYAYKYVGGVRSALTSTTIRYGYILNDSSTYTETTTNASGFFDAGTWFNGDDITDYGKNSPSIFAAIVIGGTVVHAEMITISIKGRTGSRGKVGRFFYYAGTFNVSDSTTQFLVNDAQSPYFSYNNQYWVYNPEYNPSGGTTTMSAMGTPSSSSSNWKIMTNDFKYIITEAIFGSYAHFGSFIINGDWMISQHGTINGQASTNYTQFDPDHPNEDIGTNFIPNFAIDGLTGETYQNVAYIKGEVVSKSGNIGGFTINSKWLGNLGGTNSQQGWTYITKDGSGQFFNKRETNDWALRAYGKIELVGNGLPVVIANSSDSYIMINGRLQIVEGMLQNTEVGDVYVDAWGNLKVKKSQNIKQFNLATSDFSLPANAPIGTVYFCKALLSPYYMTVSITSGSGDTITGANTMEQHNSVEIGDNSVFFVKMATNRWVTFWSE